VGSSRFPPLLKATTLFTFQRPHASDAMEYVIHGTTAHGADRLSRGLSSRGEDIVEFLRRRLLGRSRCGTTKAPSDFAASLSTRVDALACDRRQWPGSNVSNIEQTIALHICCLGYHRGIALSGPNPTPPGIIALGGVGLS
jgi:hypothetical protein